MPINFITKMNSFLTCCFPAKELPTSAIDNSMMSISLFPEDNQQFYEDLSWQFNLMSVTKTSHPHVYIDVIIFLQLVQA